VNEPESKDDKLTLGLLDAIERRSDVSQRHLASQLGIALGLTNSYLKRCAKKGYVKIKEVPANRYLYYLTPKGFAEKSRLTAHFLSTSLAFYRQAAESCGVLFETCQENGWRRVILCGPSDLAEIAHARAVGYRIDIACVYGPYWQAVDFASMPVLREWQEPDGVDAYIVTDLEDPLKTYWTIREKAKYPDRVLVPTVLGLDAAIGKN